MYRPVTCASLLLSLILISAHVSYSTHLRAGEITATRVDCNSLTFEITITVFTNLNTPVRFGGNVIDFGDSSGFRLPIFENTVRPDLGENIGMVTYTIQHTYPGPGKYIISYREPNRNGGVLNMDNSVDTRFYIETEINIDPFLGCNSTAKLLVPPIDQACSGVAFFHNPGAYDPDDGDSLSYELVVPLSNKKVQVVRYQDPSANNPRMFYNDYATGNETKDGIPAFKINPVTGTLTWDAPGATGEYNIAFLIKEWRKVNGQWVPVGSVRRDMQIIVEDCDNQRPDLNLPTDTCVVAGTTLNSTILGFDPENHDVKIEAFSEIFDPDAIELPATYSPNPPAFQSSVNGAELQFEWTTSCTDVRDQFYQVVFKITDNPDRGPKLVTFKTWRIKVLGPAPEWSGATVDQANSSVDLAWENYACPNAATMQVWRRVSSFPYDPGYCETGMPEYLGYTLIAELSLNSPGDVTTYADNNNGTGLAKGAKYCYRLVAIFPAAGGEVESVLSEEICIDPILADAPVITHVSVSKTGSDDGIMEVKWIPPLDIDPVQFPGPYEYVVQRAHGFTGTNYTNVHSGRLSTTTFQDTGIDTESNVFNYRILLFDASVSVTTPIDTSSSASSVRLEASPRLNAIQLSWQAFVPWSNVSPSYPTHDIFRGVEGESQDNFVLVSSVQVTASGFTFMDTNVNPEQMYCYRVMTRGTYGNPAIIEPLENFSQVICAAPGDDKPPCKPTTPVALNAPDCNTYADAPDFTCNQSLFSNHITWNKEQGSSCQNDIAYYNVYASSGRDGTYNLITSRIMDTFYSDLNLPSYARCYRISAVDRSGNESELSDPMCIDNCPYYELPNVFTPNDDCWNSNFSAYNDREYNGTMPCEVENRSKEKCARFVEEVAFKVFNRWGKQVYSYHGRSNSENSIYIDWDGHDNNGRELSTGVYYFIADVTFVTIDPAKRNKTLKGWVHVLR